jgi:hypothetical protein
MSKSMHGLPQESRMFVCNNMMEMYGSNNCFILKLPSETVPPWHHSLHGEIAFFKALVSQDTADVHPFPNWNSGLQVQHAYKPWSHCDHLYSYFSLSFGSFCQLVVNPSLMNLSTYSN